MNETWRYVGKALSTALKDTAQSKFLRQEDTIDKLDHYLETGNATFPIRGENKIPRSIGNRTLIFDCNTEPRTIIIGAFDRRNHPITKFIRQAYFTGKDQLNEEKDIYINGHKAKRYRHGGFISNVFANEETPEENLVNLHNDVCNVVDFFNTPDNFKPQE